MQWTGGADRLPRRPTLTGHRRPPLLNPSESLDTPWIIPGTQPSSVSTMFSSSTVEQPVSRNTASGGIRKAARGGGWAGACACAGRAWRRARAGAASRSASTRTYDAHQKNGAAVAAAGTGAAKAHGWRGRGSLSSGAARYFARRRWGPLLKGSAQGPDPYPPPAHRFLARAHRRPLLAPGGPVAPPRTRACAASAQRPPASLMESWCRPHGPGRSAGRGTDPSWTLLS